MCDHWNLISWEWSLQLLALSNHMDLAESVFENPNADQNHCKNFCWECRPSWVKIDDGEMTQMPLAYSLYYNPLLYMLDHSLPKYSLQIRRSIFTPPLMSFVSWEILEELFTQVTHVFIQPISPRQLLSFSYYTEYWIEDVDIIGVLKWWTLSHPERRYYAKTACVLE